MFRCVIYSRYLLHNLNRTYVLSAVEPYDCVHIHTLDSPLIAHYCGQQLVTSLILIRATYRPWQGDCTKCLSSSTNVVREYFCKFDDNNQSL